ncbi:MAG: spore coat protein CotJB [Lachnotalea sp.]
MMNNNMNNNMHNNMNNNMNCNMNNNMNCNMNKNINNTKVDRSSLLSKINKVSFAINDCTLFLDTHPCDEEALVYINELIPVRCNLLEKYSQCFTPLTIDSVLPTNKWDWASGPMPWEGGCK